MRTDAWDGEAIEPSLASVLGYIPPEQLRDKGPGPGAPRKYRAGQPALEGAGKAWERRETGALEVATAS
jgi:hypothetical protein